MSICILLTACTVAPGAGVPAGLSPQEAQRYLDGLTNTSVAVATGHANATQERFATSQSIQDAQTATMLPLAVQATQQALVIVKDEATRVAVATQARAVIEDRVENIWITVEIVGAVALLISMCLAILAVGYAFSARTVPDTFQLVSFNGVPIGYRQLNTRTHTWEVTPIESGKALEIEASEVAARQAWWDAFVQLARAAAEYGTWSIEVLSSRDKVRGVASESAVGELRRCVGEPLGLIKDYGGSRGWDWAGSASYARLEAPSEAALGTLPLPRGPEGGIKAAPIIAQAKTVQDKPGEARELDRAVTYVSPAVKRGRKDMRDGTKQ